MLFGRYELSATNFWLVKLIMILCHGGVAIALHSAPDFWHPWPLVTLKEC